VKVKRVTKPTAASIVVPDVVEQIRALPSEFLRCRDISHDWSVPKGFFKVEVEGGVRGALYVEREVLCRSCGTVRIELFRVHERYMDKLSYRYTYPSDYRLVGDKKGVRVAGTVQLELYMRSIADFNDLS
jgi:hypothetical protein